MTSGGVEDRCVEEGDSEKNGREKENVKEKRRTGVLEEEEEGIGEKK